MPLMFEPSSSYLRVGGTTQLHPENLKSGGDLEDAPHDRGPDSHLSGSRACAKPDRIKITSKDRGWR